MVYVDLFLTIYLLNVLVSYLFFNRFYSNMDIVRGYIKYKREKDSKENRAKYFIWINRYLTLMIFCPVYNTYVWIELFVMFMIKLVKHFKNK